MTTEDTKDRGKSEAGRKGGLVGGRRRAESLSEEERSEIARKAAEARWTRRLPVAAYGASDRPLRIGDAELPCYVLEDGRRVLTQGGVMSALGLAKSGGNVRGVHRLEGFASGKTVSPYFERETILCTGNPIQFMIEGEGEGPGQVAHGYEATILADICNAVLSARRDGALRKQQMHIAIRCEILLTAFSKVGIVALVDEATGYQDERARDELHRILEAYIQEELRPWVRTFPHAFFREMFRLYGWEYREGSNKRPGYAGKFINATIYANLPAPVLPELRKLNPVRESGRRSHAFHQFLTEETGIPHLDDLIKVITVLMRVSSSKSEFWRLFRRQFPKPGDSKELPFPEHEE